MNTAVSTAPVADTLAERIKQMLGQGLISTVVASAVGCDPSYISQLMEDESFKQDVLVLRAGRAEAGIKRDTKWDTIEDLALEKAAQVLPFVTRPQELIRIAGMANAAKRRATEFSSGQDSAAPTVTLVLPQSAVIHFQMNANSQVVEVDGRSMQALPNKQLVKQLEARREARVAAGTVEVVAPHAPRALPAERKRVETILDQIGYSDEAVPVANVLRAA